MLESELTENLQQLVGKPKHFWMNDVFEKYKQRTAPDNAPFKLYEAWSNTSADSQDSEGDKNDRRMRGPYRKYTFDEKRKAVERINAGEDVKAISRQFRIPRRNLLRWKKNGCERKEGGGRPTDNFMEKIIYDKIISGALNDEKQIRDFAMQLSNIQSFKASKGWFVKFCSRFNLRLLLRNGQPQYESQL